MKVLLLFTLIFYTWTRANYYFFKKRTGKEKPGFGTKRRWANDDRIFNCCFTLLILLTTVNRHDKLVMKTLFSRVDWINLCSLGSGAELSRFRPLRNPQTICFDISHINGTGSLCFPAAIPIFHSCLCPQVTQFPLRRLCGFNLSPHDPC